MKALNKIIGSGITFPFNIKDGKVVPVDDLSLIRSSIANILNYEVGTRFRNEAFGSRVWECLEEPNDNITKSLLTHFIIESLTTWEPKIQIKKGSIEYTQVKHDKVNISLTYRIRNSNIEETYIFPFYKEINY